MASGSSPPLNILHVLRAPVGGLFRHVTDLARGQAARGHRVGLIADSSTGGPQAEAILAALAKVLTHGVSRTPMSRHIGAGDLFAVRLVAQRAEAASADVIHGHGAKGGAYARLAALPSPAGGMGRTIRAYTPHGGSLHYRWGSPTGLFYLSAERALMRHTDLFLFESAYGRDIFKAKIGTKVGTQIGSKIGEPKGLVRVIYNGVTDDEFQPIVVREGATDLLFVGELRMLKGVDVLIAAIKTITQDGRNLSATIVGEGPDRVRFEREVVKQGLGDKIKFVGAKPARAAFALGRLLVVPSRAESLPYIVLEAAAAGVPMIASHVGGIPEIFGPDVGALVPPGDPAVLSRAIIQALQDRGARHSATLRLKARIRALFSADAMTDAVIAAYREALAPSAGLSTGSSAGSNADSGAG
jgi:glycosyltransferase involved in cell wall biosynthesis